MKVLLVDDDAAFMHLVTRVLEDRQHQVFTSDTPYGVSALIVRHVPDVAVIDVRMPGLTGPQLVHVISELPLVQRPRVALWSALDGDSLRQLQRETGLPCIAKTAGPIRVVEQIETLGRRGRTPAMGTPTRS